MNRLPVKLTIAFLLVALVAVAVMAVLSVRSTGEEFRRYVVQSSMMGEAGIADELAALYSRQGNWDGAAELLAGWTHGMGGMMGLGRRGMGGNATFSLVDAGGRVIVDATGTLAGQRLPDNVLAQGAPVVVGGKTVGTVLNMRPADVVLDTQGNEFLQSVQRTLLIAGLAAVLVALLAGVFISGRLTAPLQKLKGAAAAVAAGQFDRRVTETSTDEIGDLARAFNSMAADLEQAETVRRNMLADVAHELRTPLTVIQGNLQAILEGVYPLDREQVETIYDESRLLTRLVEDLHDLAQAEAGQLRLDRAPLDANRVAQATVAKFAAAAGAAGVALRLETAPGAQVVNGDADRLAQLLGNLIGNALRYTPAGGQILVTISSLPGRAVIEVSDTGSGISAEDLAHVFDRFYRGEKSRSRRGGGAGLGLAIARQIATAHGGELTVRSSPGQGSCFTLSLPADKRSG